MIVLGRFFAFALTVFLALGGAFGRAQSSCGTRYLTRGVFICYPASASSHLSSPLFHLSAQINATDRSRIRHYSVLIDGARISELLLANPVQQLSIETNLLSPSGPGPHQLRVVAEGVGAAAVEQLRFEAKGTAYVCDQFSRVDARSCLPGRPASTLIWEPRDQTVSLTHYLDLYSRNLKSLECDVADAVTVDSSGSVYTASHRFTGVEVRRYSPDGSLLYDRVIDACSRGYTSVTGLGIGSDGWLWVSGVTTACLQRSTQTQSRSSQPQDFLIRIDSSNSAGSVTVNLFQSSTAGGPALSLDENGTAYTAGGLICAWVRNQQAPKWCVQTPGARWKAVAAVDGGGQVYAAGIRGGKISVVGLQSATGNKVSGIDLTLPASKMAESESWALTRGREALLLLIGGKPSNKQLPLLSLPLPLTNRLQQIPGIQSVQAYPGVVLQAALQGYAAGQKTTK